MRCKDGGFSVSDAAKVLGVHRPSLERLLRLGNCQFGFYIPPKRDGGQGSYYVYRERVEAYITAQDIKFACPYAQQHIKELVGSTNMNTDERRKTS